MDLLLALWLPILVSAAAVFVVSFLTWMVIPLHKADHAGVPDDDALRAAIRTLGIKPGVYMFPFAATNKERGSKEFIAKFEQGPAGMLRVFRNANMGVNMLLTFLVFLAASFLIGYLLSMTLPRGSDFWRVFQVAATAGVLAYCFAPIPNQIWFQSTRAAKVSGVVEGVLFGLTTGLAFALLWPR